MFQDLPSLEAALASTLPLAAAALSFFRKPAPPRRLGRYTLCEKIGEGGMGEVFRAWDEVSQRPAAIKLLRGERTTRRDRERLEREARITSLLAHPNTVQVLGCGRTAQGSFYYAMEYLDGVDLQTLVERDGPQPAARVAELLAQLADALHETHELGLIHRDVKPANVMLCQRDGSDHVKLLDFGLSKRRGANDDDGQLVGTPLYLSPEALTAPSRMDARSDLYALGALGYFLLTGQPPFAGDDLVDVCRQHLHAPALPPSERLGSPVPAELERLILSCLAKAPEQRPRSAAELCAALRACVRRDRVVASAPLAA